MKSNRSDFNSSLNQLPDEIQLNIRKFLDKQSLFSLSATAAKYNQLYLADRCMYFAMHGLQEEVLAIISAHPEVLSEKVKISEDPAGRVFKNITVFQYLLWSLDSPMWKQIVNSVSDNKIIQNLYKQYLHHEKYGIKYLLEGKKIEEKHYDFSPWILALGEYIAKHNLQRRNQVTGESLNKYWCEKVGDAQAKTVINVVNEFCREDVDYYPVPVFGNSICKRNDKIFFNSDYELEPLKVSWFAKSAKEKYKLGKNYAICRSNSSAFALSLPSSQQDILDCQMNLQALENLEKSRHQDFVELGIQLSPQHSIEVQQQLQGVLKVD